MNQTNQRIETQYLRTNLNEDIITRLNEQGTDLSQITRAHTAGPQEFDFQKLV